MQEGHNLDNTLHSRLTSYTEREAEYWSFRGKAVREQTHAYMQYPAMMVPQMQGKLIQIFCELLPSIKSVFDPFVGSGTVMTEAMLQGLNFAGQDINPLSVLVCHAKAGPFYQRILHDKVDNLFTQLAQDTSACIEADFPGLSKWFRDDIAIALSRIRRAIRREQDVWVRRFLWVALAEVVRLTSNSRTSTFKLHIRPQEEIVQRELAAVDLFKRIVSENVTRLETHRTTLDRQGYLTDDRYRGVVKIAFHDSMVSPPVLDHAPIHDLLVTSPPYGDNETTVPYGQYSYLPLQWIDFEDIDANVDRSCLRTTKEIDNRSIGGKNRVRDPRDTDMLKDLSDAFKQTAVMLKDEPPDRMRRVATFCCDLNQTLDPALAALKPNGYMIWTIGNRQVAGKPIPTDAILTELLMARGATLVAKLQRAIPSKRMAVKNKVAATMRAETVLIMRKCAV